MQRITSMVEQGQADGSISAASPPTVLAEGIYQLWLGASLLVKVTHSEQPFDVAMTNSQRLLN
jgi:TetR/AcrR family transcriptional repressor of nem operon